jgi:hypothetical protein
MPTGSGARGAVLGVFVVLLAGAAWAQRPMSVSIEVPPPADAGPPSDAAPPSAAPESVWPRPDPVTVGVHINDIQSIDLKTHTYAIDAYFWFRWNDPAFDPATTMEFINPSDQWGHTIKNHFEAPVVLPNGQRYQVTRVQGRFSKKLPLFNYPFDRQALEIVFEDSVSEAKDMVFVLGEPAVTINPHLVLPGYEIGQPTVRVANERYPTHFGDLRAPEPGLYSRLRVEIPVSRPMFAYAVKLLLPVFCVILCAGLMFLFAPRYVDARVGVGTMALLSIVALQMTFNQDLPDVGYLMLMDKIYICSYLFVIGGLAAVVRTTHLVDEGRVEAGTRLRRGILVALALGYLGTTGALVGQAMAQG